jgi:hypothetical protein
MKAMKCLTRALQEPVERYRNCCGKLLAYSLLQVGPNLGLRIITTAPGSVWRELIEYVRRMKDFLSEFNHAIGSLTPRAVVLFVSTSPPIEKVLVGIEPFCLKLVAGG